MQSPLTLYELSYTLEHVKVQLSIAVFNIAIMISSNATMLGGFFSTFDNHGILHYGFCIL